MQRGVEGGAVDDVPHLRQHGGDAWRRVLVRARQHVGLPAANFSRCLEVCAPAKGCVREL